MTTDNETPSIIAICGSNREHNYPPTTLQHTLAADKAGAETELIDLREYDLPLFAPNLYFAPKQPGDSSEFLKTIENADGIILGSPVYQSTISST